MAAFINQNEMEGSLIIDESGADHNDVIRLEPSPHEQLDVNLLEGPDQPDVILLEEPDQPDVILLEGPDQPVDDRKDGRVDYSNTLSNRIHVIIPKNENIILVFL